MNQNKEILKKRLSSLELQFQTLQSYYVNLSKKGLKRAETIEESSLQDAYLKRFASFQDYLGSKVFPLLAEVAGLPGVKMTEVLENLEREGVIETVESWAQLRALRNVLEHDYPEVSELGLRTLAEAMEQFKVLEKIFKKAIDFAGRFS